MIQYYNIPPFPICLSIILLLQVAANPSHPLKWCINLTTPSDRPLIRIKRKGRPFATCTVCQSTPCTAPSEHARAKREAELKTPSKVTQTQHTQLPTHERELGSHENNTHLDALSLGILGKQRGPSRCAIGKVLIASFLDL